MRRFSIFATIAALAVWTPQAGAEGENDQSAPDEPSRRYTVELIIFAYGEGVADGNEIWLPDEPAIEERAVNRPFRLFGDPDDTLTEIEAPRIPRRYMDLEIERLAPADYTTDEIYDKLVELDAYQPLMRAAWTQGTFEKALTSPIELRMLDQPPPGLDGRLMLYRGRFLHFVVDLTLDAEYRRLPTPQDRTVPTFGDARGRNDTYDGYRDSRPAIRYRISEDRIMRNGDIRYFDHPKFGAIAKITRFEEPEEEVFDDTADLLPGESSR